MRCYYPDAYIAYAHGKGSELLPHGQYPPKMASIASSSRFCYLALRDGADALAGTKQVCFEQECRIIGISGTAPQLDAWIPGKNLYVESKCHEIFDRHTPDLNLKYWSCFFGENNAFGFAVHPRPTSGKTFPIPFSAFGCKDSPKRFDLKQFLCHLLGIASQKHDSAALVYLFFKPVTNDKKQGLQLDSIFTELTAELRCILQSTPIQKFCKTPNLHIYALAQCASVMGPFTAENAVYLASL